MQKFNIKNQFIVIITLVLIAGCSAKKDLSSLKKSYASQQATLEKTQKKNESAMLELISLRKENISLQEENKDLKIKLLSAKQTIREISEQEPECPEEMKKGLVFKVQIGAYEKRELPVELTKSINIDTEEKKDLQKIIVGQFREYPKAESLKKQLQAMGVADAFIVAYVDDRRKELSDVLADLKINK